MTETRVQIPTGWVFKKNKMEKENKLIECICGCHNFHTSECKRHNRLLKYYKKREESRKQLRKEHRCTYYNCGKKVKPVYPQFCPEHKPKKKLENVK